MNSPSVGGSLKNYVHRYAANTGYSLEYLPGAMDEKGRLRDLVKGLHAINRILIMIYIRGAYDKIPYFFRIGPFIDSAHMKI